MWLPVQWLNGHMFRNLTITVISAGEGKNEEKKGWKQLGCVCWQLNFALHQLMCYWQAYICLKTGHWRLSATWKEMASKHPPCVCGLGGIKLEKKNQKNPKQKPHPSLSPSPRKKEDNNSTAQDRGSRPEWCISSMIYCRDTPFWSETLDMQSCPRKSKDLAHRCFCQHQSERSVSDSIPSALAT